MSSKSITQSSRQSQNSHFAYITLLQLDQSYMGDFSAYPLNLGTKQDARLCLESVRQAMEGWSKWVSKYEVSPST